MTQAAGSTEHGSPGRPAEFTASRTHAQTVVAGEICTSTGQTREGEDPKFVPEKLLTVEPQLCAAAL